MDYKHDNGWYAKQHKGGIVPNLYRVYDNNDQVVISSICPTRLLDFGFKKVSDPYEECIREMEKFFNYRKTGICLTSMPPQYPTYGPSDLIEILKKYLVPKKSDE